MMQQVQEQQKEGGGYCKASKELKGLSRFLEIKSQVASTLVLH